MRGETKLDAWCKGYEAGWAGSPEELNPYAEQSDLSRSWAAGYARSRSQTHVALPWGGLRPMEDVSRVLSSLDGPA